MLDLAADRDEDRLVVADQADDVVAGDVGGRDDGDLRPVESRVEVDSRRTGRGRRSSGSWRRTRRPGRRGRRRTSPRRSAWPVLRGGGAPAFARGRGRRLPLDDQGVGRAAARADRGAGPAGPRSGSSLLRGSLHAARGYHRARARRALQRSPRRVRWATTAPASRSDPQPTGPDRTSPDRPALDRTRPFASRTGRLLSGDTGIWSRTPVKHRHGRVVALSSGLICSRPFIPRIHSSRSAYRC